MGSTQKYLLQRKHLQFDTKKENLKKRYKKMENQKNTFFGENIISSFLQLDAKKELQKKLHTKIPSSEKTLFLHFYNWTQNKKTKKKAPHKNTFFRENIYNLTQKRKT